MSCRFHGRSIREGMKKAEQPLQGIDADAVDFVELLAVDERFRFNMDLEQGDIQILNDYAVLHARDEFEDWPEQERRRHLLRLWINLDLAIARPLDPVLAEPFTHTLNIQDGFLNNCTFHEYVAD